MTILRRCMLVIIITLTSFTTNAFASNRCVSMIDQHAYTFMLNLADCDLHPADLYDVEAYLKAHPTITALNLEDNTQLFDGANSQILSQDTQLKYLSVKNTMTAANGDIVTSDLAKIPHLTILDLSNNNLTDASIDSLMKAHSLSALNLEDNPRISFNGVLILAGHPSITHLNLTHIPLDNVSLKALSQNTRLTHISLGDGSHGRIDSYSDESLMGFAKNPNLVEFSLTATRISLPFLQALARSNTLRSLALPYDNLNEKSIKAISLNKHITSLDLSGNSWMGFYENFIARVASLTHLNLNNVETVDLDQLAKINHLVELHVDGDRLQGSFASFIKHPTLKVLSVASTYLASNMPSQYLNIARIATLSSLDVSKNFGLTDDSIVAFATNPSLRTLIINNEDYYSDRFTSKSTIALSMDPHLTSLSISNTYLPNIEKLLNNPALKVLDVSGFWETKDLGLPLAKARYLRKVDISFNQFTPETIQAIAANPSIVTIINKRYE